MTLTIDLDPALFARAEARAAREGTTLAQLVERLVETQEDAKYLRIARGELP